MIKNFFLCFAFLCVVAIGFAGSVDDNRIAAVINDEVVTKFEIDQEIAPVLKRMKDKYPADVFAQKKRELWNMRLMQVIENKLLLQEARRKKITVDPRQVENSFAELLKRAGGSIAELDKILRKQGLTVRRQRQEIEEKLMIDQLLRQQLEPAIYISPAHIQDYYYAHKDKYQRKRRIKVQNILISTENRSSKEAEAIAHDVYNKIKDGMDFSKAVEKYSEGQFKHQNGVVDFFDKGTYFASFEKHCFGMQKKGEISRPFKSPIGWHIVKLLDSEGGEVTPISEVASRIRMQLHQEEYRKKVEEYIKDLKKKSYIKFYTKGQ